MANKSGVPGSLRAEVMRRGDFTCANCGRRGYEHRGPKHVAFPTSEPGVFLSIDHIIPRSRGGSSHDPRNLRILCTRCNSTKGSKVVAVFD